MDVNLLNHGNKAILRAVADGRAEPLAGCCPDLAIDGAWCDHTAVLRLVTGGWIRSERR
jgi:hypothetical protein